MSRFHEVRRRWGIVLFAFAGALLVGLLWAGRGGGSNGVPTPSPEPGEFLAQGYAELAAERSSVTVGTSTWDLLGALLVPTLIVVVAAYATIRVLRSLNQRVAASVSHSELLELVDTLSLAGSGVVHIVRVGERYLLIGAGSGGLSLLGELQAAEVERLKSARSRSTLGGAAVPPFLDILQARLLRFRSAPDQVEEDVERPSPTARMGPQFGFTPETGASMQRPGRA